VSRRALLLLAVSLPALIAALVLGGLLATRENSSPRIRTPPTGPYRGSMPPGVFRLPGFTLPDYTGKIVSSRDLRGSVVVLTFLDTDCKDSCPVIAGVIGAAVPRLSPSERRQVASIALTVNPAADTPRKVRRFLLERGALGKLDFLLGSVKTLEPVWRSFQILSAHESGDANFHSAPDRIYNRNGVWVSTLHPGVDLTAANLVHDVRVALRS
jgi:cytochrome oxidase Cu insertion factor (SCO1/SenC/PrrC family)